MPKEKSLGRGRDLVIVIGGGMSGLCTAAAVSRHFRKVTLIDRDRLGDADQPRSGVPQGKHAHVLLGRGARELERLFPGFRDDMLAAGANHIDWQQDIATLAPEGWVRRNRLRSQTDLTLLMSSRPLTEQVVRRRVRQLANVTVREQTEVVALRTAPDQQVCGVMLQTRGDAQAAVVDADLVIDTSGRRSRLVAWLEAAGHAVPFEEVVDSKLGYASRWYEKDPARWNSDWWWKGMWVDPDPPSSLFGGAIFPIENNRLLVTLAGCSTACPPADEAGFDQYMENLRSPLFAATVRSCKPVSPVAAFRDMPNRLRHFHKLRRPAKGLLASGDAVCSLSPIYAQGMSVAAACAAALDDHLGTHDPRQPDFEARFFRRQAAIIADAWTLATSADFSLPETEGRKPPFLNLFDPYFAAYVRAMSVDPQLNLLFERVSQLLAPSWRMLTPGVMARVVWKQARARGYYLDNGPDRVPRADLLEF